jgi:hypothetical protein
MEIPMSFLTSKYGGRQAFMRAAVFAAVLLGTQGPSFADNLGYRGYQQAWDPSKPTLTNVNVAWSLYGGLGTDVVNAWNKFTASATQDWTAQLSKPNFAGDGYTLENPRLQISGVDSVEMRVAPVQDSLAPTGFQVPSTTAPILVIHSTGTRIDAGSTTPYTSSGNDPSFHVTFDLTAYVKLAIGPKVSTVSAPIAEVVLTNSQYFPDNATANDAQILGPLQNVFGARTFAQRVADSINGQVVNIKGYLGSAINAANDELRKRAPAGYVVAGIFADSQWLNVVLAPHLQPNSNGQMAGTFTVSGLSGLPALQRSSSNGGNLDCSKAFGLSDSVQVQPDYVASLNPLQFQAGSGPTTSIDNQLVISSGTVQPSADGWSCRYLVAGLAENYVNYIRFNQPGVVANGSLPSIGYLIVDVGFQGCGTGGSIASVRPSEVACLSQPACASPLTPQGGTPVSCNLMGRIQMSGNGGVGVAKQSVFANQTLNPGTPVETKTAAPGVWGAQTLERTTIPVTTAPQWGTPAPATPISRSGVGSSLNRGVGSSLQQARPLQAPAGTTTAPSVVSPQF